MTRPPGSDVPGPGPGGGTPGAGTRGGGDPAGTASAGRAPSGPASASASGSGSASGSASASGRAHRWRDRHGRGLRGPLTPPGLPISRSRSETFDDLVLEAVEALEPQLGDRLDGVEFAVEDIPPAAVTSALAAGDPVPLASAFPAADPVPARVVVYRRPVELRGGPEVADLVAVVLVEQLAALLGIPPEEIDPDLGD